MRQLLIACGLLLALAASARAWSPPEPIGDGFDKHVAVAPDGTTVRVWVTFGGAVMAQVGDGPVATLAPFASTPAHAAAGNGGQAAVSWNTPSGAFVALAAPDGTFGAPTGLGTGNPDFLFMNPDGAASVIVNGVPYGAPTRELYRPPGGTFGTPIGFALQTVIAATMTPRDETVGAVGAYGSPIVLFSRLADSQPVRENLDEARTISEVALVGDAQGRILATYLPQEDAGTLGAAVRAPDGTWAQRDIALPKPAERLHGDVDDAGDAVIALRDVVPKTDALRPSYAGPVRIISGSLATGRFDAPELFAAESGTGALPGVDVVSAADGSTLIAYDVRGSGTVAVRRRAGTGPFDPPETAACGRLTQAVATGAIVVDDGLVRDTPGGAPTCPVPDLGPSGPEVAFSPRRVVAGRRVVVDASGLRPAGFEVIAGDFEFARTKTGLQHAKRIHTEPDARVRHVFPRAGTWWVFAAAGYNGEAHSGPYPAQAKTFKIHVYKPRGNG